MSLILIFFFSVSTQADVYSLMECGALGPKGDQRTYCQFCLSPLSSKNDRVCSKTFLSDSGTADPKVAAEELSSKINNGLIQIKNLPKEGFDVFDFHRKNSKKGECNYSDADVKMLEKQMKYLKWKIEQIKSGKKSCAN